jgi:hypothetical protein
LKLKVWRRGGDSNPRHPFGVKLLSRQPCSATPAPLRGCYPTQSTEVVRTLLSLPETCSGSLCPFLCPPSREIACNTASSGGPLYHRISKYFLNLNFQIFGSRPRSIRRPCLLHNQCEIGAMAKGCRAGTGRARDRQGVIAGRRARIPAAGTTRTTRPTGTASTAAAATANH